MKSKRTLYLVPISGFALHKAWGFLGPTQTMGGVYYIASNIAGTYNLEKAMVYTGKELKGRKIHIHV